MEDWLGSADDRPSPPHRSTLTLGLHHEQQHQELILTDLKHAFASNPLRPIYRERRARSARGPARLAWTFRRGVRPIGHEGLGFAFDNETPRHPNMSRRSSWPTGRAPTPNILAFLDDGGYDRPEFWLSDGWAARKARGWTAPLYWEKAAGRWTTMTLAGMTEVRLDEPVTHVSFYEADAFARWSDARLATEAEWEVAAEGRPIEGNFLESGRYHPTPAACRVEPRAGPDVRRRLGVDPEPLHPLPRLSPAAGALGEYNGKFMCNQIILRGGSCATPRSHIRATYRNFFGPEARWQFTGIRLARDVLEATPDASGFGKRVRRS